MWLMNHRDQAVNLQNYHTLTCENEGTVFANCYAPGEDEDRYEALYVGKDMADAELFRAWLLRCITEGRRVVHVSDY